MLDTLPPEVTLIWPDTAAYVSCDFVIVELIINDDFFIDPESILLTVFSDIYGVRALPESVASITDSYYYFPIPFPTIDGDSIALLMNPVADYDENESESFMWFFKVDKTPPEITSILPIPGLEITDPNPDIEATINDPAGINVDSSFITINSDTFHLLGPYTTWIGTHFSFHTDWAGMFFTGGDTVEVCITTADNAEGCGINYADSCFEFSIATGGPTAELYWPFENAWISCPDTSLIFRILDPEGVDSFSIELTVNGDSYDITSPSLSWYEPFLYLDVSSFSDGPVTGILQAHDALGNPMDPHLSFAVGIDMTPPYLVWANPVAGSAFFELDPLVRFRLDDNLSGMQYSPTLVGVSVDGSPFSWFNLEDFEFNLEDSIYSLDSTAIPPLYGGDTVNIRVIAYDSVTVCAANGLDTSWFFYIPSTPPEAELVLPAESIVSACSNQGIFYRIFDSDGLIESSIQLEINSITYDLSNSELEFENDTLRFTPSSFWTHGAHISGGLITARDSLYNNIDAIIPFDFYVDLMPPQIIEYSPAEFSLTGDTLKKVRIRLQDTPAGVDPTSLIISVDGSNYSVDGVNLRWEEPYLVFDPVYAGAWDTVDTVEFCLLEAADNPDTCEPNRADSLCWEFYIDARDPVAVPPVGAIVACVQETVELYLWAPGGGIDETSILLSINDTTYTHLSERISFENDTLKYFPPEPWIDGDSVRCLLVHAEGPISSIDSIYWGFLMDYSSPYLIADNPFPGEIVESVNPLIEFTLGDSITEIIPGAFQLVVDGNSFDYSHFALDIAGDSFQFDPEIAGLHIAGGDTVEVCVHAEDLASPDFCGPNILDSCYYFYIESGGPIAELVSPDELTPYGCDSSITINIVDDDGLDLSTLLLLVDGDSISSLDYRLDIRGDSLIVQPNPIIEDTILVEFLTLDDSLENAAEYNSWEIIFDFTPPNINWISPEPDTTLTSTAFEIKAKIDDNLSGDSCWFDPTLPFTISGDTIIGNISGLSNYDTVDICLHATDLAVCPNQDSVCTRFYIDAAPPLADLVLPDDSTTTSCDPQRVVIVLQDPSGIDPSDLTVVIAGDTLTIADSLLRFLGDSIIYNPLESFELGEITVEIISVSDRWGNELTDFASAFYFTLAPEIVNVSPEPWFSSDSISPNITAVFESETDSGFFVIDSDTISVSCLDFWGDSMQVRTNDCGLMWDADDTVNVCAVSVLFSDYCSPSMAESCWSFTILYSPPHFEIIEPAPDSWSSCPDQGVIIALFDDEGIDSSSIVFSADGVEYYIDSDELILSSMNDTLYFEPLSNWATDTVEFCVVSLSDMLGAEADSLPYCWNVLIDTLPPTISISPPGDSYLPIPTSIFQIVIDDYQSGPVLDSASIDNIWFNSSDIELSWAEPICSLDIWDLIPDDIPDTINICVRARDRANYCGPNDTLVCWQFTLNTTIPLLELLHPTDNSVTSCNWGPLIFSVEDPDSYDSTSVRLVLNGVEIIWPDDRFTFAPDSVIFNPNSPWDHNSTVSGTLTIADSLGSLSEPFVFSFMIDSLPPVVSGFMPAANSYVLDTFQYICFDAEDTPAGIDTNSLVITIDSNEVVFTYADGSYCVDREPLGLCEFDNVLVEISGLEDLAVDCGANLMADTFWSFTIADDDTVPPEILSIEPAYALSGLPFVISAEIQDTSDVYSAVLYWSFGTELDGNIDTIAMNNLSSNIWNCTDSIVVSSGQWITFAICATDNDTDCNNLLDRSFGCDTFTISLSPLGLNPIWIDNSGNWDPYAGTTIELCTYQEYFSYIGFVNPDSIYLFADSAKTTGREIIEILPWADTSLAPGDTLFLPLRLYSEQTGQYSDTVLVFDNRLLYPIGIDTLEFKLVNCQFYAGPNPFSPNGDGFYDEFKIELPKAGDVEIDFYKLEGLKVRTLQGKYRQYAWDGKDNFGNDLQQGIYLWIIKIDGEIFKHGSVTIAR